MAGRPSEEISEALGPRGGGRKGFALGSGAGRICGLGDGGMPGGAQTRALAAFREEREGRGSWLGTC